MPSAKEGGEARAAIDLLLATSATRGIAADAGDGERPLSARSGALVSAVGMLVEP